MRRYSYRYAEGREVIFGGHFEFEIRGTIAIVLLADHLIPLAVSEIPTRIYRRFLPALKPSAVTFVEFDAAAGRYQLVDLRWTDTAGAYRYLGAAVISEAVVCSLGLAGAWWTQALAAATRAPQNSRASV